MHWGEILCPNRQGVGLHNGKHIQNVQSQYNHSEMGKQVLDKTVFTVEFKLLNNEK